MPKKSSNTYSKSHQKTTLKHTKSSPWEHILWDLDAQTTPGLKYGPPKTSMFDPLGPNFAPKSMILLSMCSNIFVVFNTATYMSDALETYITLRYITCQFMLHYMITSHTVHYIYMFININIDIYIFNYIILHHITSYLITSHYLTSHHIRLYQITLRWAALHYIA